MVRGRGGKYKWNPNGKNNENKSNVTHTNQSKGDTAFLLLYTWQTETQFQPNQEAILMQSLAFQRSFLSARLQAPYLVEVLPGDHDLQVVNAVKLHLKTEAGVQQSVDAAGQNLGSSLDGQRCAHTAAVQLRNGGDKKVIKKKK